MICMSVTIFMTYADLGFLTSAQKKAGEAFGRRDVIEEADQIGFTGFVLGIFLLIYILVLIVCAVNPGIIVRNIGIDEAGVARVLFIILAIFSPVTIANRLINMIFTIRIEGYIPQFQQIVLNIVVICSALFFFRPGQYDIIGYFLFSNIMQAAAFIVQLFAAKSRYHYPFGRLLKAMHFNRRIFKESKGLALTAFYNTLCWVLFFELDLIVVGRLFGAAEAAVFGVAVTITSFFRTFTGGLIFIPFQAQFNQLSADKNNDPLVSLWSKAIRLSAPVIVIPVVATVLFLDKIIPAWVGPYYIDSILIARLFILCYIFHFITVPSNFLLFAREKLQVLNVASTLNVIVYWIGIGALNRLIGLPVFGIFKLIGFWFPGAVTAAGVHQFVKGKWLQTIKTIILPILLSILVMMAVHHFCNPFIEAKKGKVELLKVFAATGGITIVGFMVYCSISREFFQTIRNAISKSGHNR